MGGWLILIAVFLLLQSLARRKARKETVIDWQGAAAGESDREALRQELPGRWERIRSCYASLEEIQADWAAGQRSLRDADEAEDLPEEPVSVYYTHLQMDRAIVVWNGKNYAVCFEELSLASENSLTRIYTPGMPCGSWNRSYPNRYFDTREEAERIAQRAMQWLN